MFVQIKAFKPELLQEIIEITKRNLSERYNDFIFLDIFRSWPSAFLVGMADDRVAGFICGGISGEKEARILMLAVDFPYRKMGLGTGLVTLFEQEAAKVKVNRIKLEVKTDNLEAIDFYKGRGYIITGLLPSYYNDGTDAYLMQRFI
ncbi:MAG: GNAT family N-acetyltransferase [Candidatus Thermoplasmatota archaeon]|jgi:ribosomal-protein-alanine N-acetyltransferase|nr:GNAT family N-acetyltransferase [Candidatus Thermoplasmatota archaeon]